MKKILALLIAASMIIALAACGGAETGTDATGDVAETSAPAESGGETAAEEETSEAAAAGPDENGFIYYADFNSLMDSSRKSTANTDERYGTLNVAQFASPTELQPFNHMDMGKGIVINEVYERLLQKNGDEYLPFLAKEWKQIDDTTYEFTLFDYIKDTDGNNIKASDVVFSYGLEADAGFAHNFSLFKEAKVVSDYVVSIELTEKINDLDSFEAIFSQVDIVSEKAYNEHDFNSEPVGTGPYKVENFVTGNNITLAVNEDYWQTDESALLPSQRRTCEKISVDIIGDPALRLLALEEGSAMYCDLNSEDIPDFAVGGRAEDQFFLIKKDDTTLYELVPNITDKSPMSDPNLRLAVYYAIDSEQFVLAMNEQLNSAANCGSIPAYGDWNDSWGEWTNYMTDYDPDLSQKYLKDSSYNNEVLRIIYEDMPGKMTTAEILQLQLEAAGIKSELQLLAHPLYLEALSNPDSYDIAVLSGGTADKTISRIDSFYGPDGYAGIAYQDDKDFQKKIEECGTLDGYSPELTEELLQYVIDNGYGYSCTYGSKITAYNKIYAGLYYLDGDGDLVPGACDYYLD